MRGTALPELPSLPIARARIMSQGIDGRVSLQMVDRDGALPDMAGPTGRVDIWSGTPGVSADPTPGQEVVIAFSRADASDPVAFLAAPKGQPAHVPIKVRHEAITEIRLVGESPGVVKVGATGTTEPVAKATLLQAYLVALEAYLEQAHIAIAPLVAALPDAGAAYNTARGARLGAAGYSGFPAVAVFPFLPTTKLEAA
jgi:hypothetical protein